jgi:uncharacterized protein YoaH (UPF0181 family)
MFGPIGHPRTDGQIGGKGTFERAMEKIYRAEEIVEAVARCMKEGIVGGEAFAVDASIVVADALRRRGVAKVEDLDPASSRGISIGSR